MQRKIDQTRRLADKINKAKEFGEQKFEALKKLDESRDAELRERKEKIQGERQRR